MTTTDEKDLTEDQIDELIADPGNFKKYSDKQLLKLLMRAKDTVAEIEAGGGIVEAESQAKDIQSAIDFITHNGGAAKYLATRDKKDIDSWLDSAAISAMERAAE